MNDERRQWPLSKWLSWQETMHPKSWDLGLERVGTVWQRLGAPRIGKHIVTVAGTNGKGSCVRWAEAIAMAHGISVMTFTSPHLLDYCERIRFNGDLVEEKALIDAFCQIDVARGDITLTFFEWATLAAFILCAQANPSLVVLEVGLGGRLDATNLIDADAAIITRIGLDHTDWLGDTLDKIAYEKAGIMRSGQTVVFADNHPPNTLLSEAKRLGTTLWQQDVEIGLTQENQSFSVMTPTIHLEHMPQPSMMMGAHQLRHFAAVTSVLAQWFTLSEDKLKHVLVKTNHEGRLMLVHHSDRADVLFDVAHNADSAEILADHLATIKGQYRQCVAVCAMLKDKDHVAVFRHLRPQLAKWSLFALPSPRATPVRVLYDAAITAGIDPTQIACYDNAAAAWQSVCKLTQVADLIVVTGSFVTVAEILTLEKINE